jgi:hypothetical protein
MSTIKELRNNHQNIKNNLENTILLFCSLLGVEKFNYGNEEIDSIGDFYIQNFKYPEKSNLTIENLRNYFFDYCCIAFIKSNGGELLLDENKRSISFGKSIIINYGGVGYPWVGISIDAWMKRLEEGRFKGKLSEAINRNLKQETT